MSHLKYADAKYVFLTDFDGTITLLVSCNPDPPDERCAVLLWSLVTDGNPLLSS